MRGRSAPPALPSLGMHGGLFPDDSTLTNWDELLANGWYHDLGSTAMLKNLPVAVPLRTMVTTYLMSAGKPQVASH